MNFTALFTYAFLTAFTPGPNNIMAMTNAIKFGLSRAMVFCFGVLFGFLVDMTLCALGTAFLFDSIPSVEPVMRWIGAAYILFLAWVVFNDGKNENADAGDDAESDPVAESAAPRAGGFFTGLFMQLINVKVLLYGITALSTFILPHYRSAGTLWLSVAALSVLGFAGTACWAVFGSLFRNFHARHRRGVNAVMALALVYCAVRTLL